LPLGDSCCDTRCEGDLCESASSTTGSMRWLWSPPAPFFDACRDCFSCRSSLVTF
jgi:hypothetical protein